MTREELIEELNKIGIPYILPEKHWVYVNPIIWVSEDKKDDFIERLSEKGLFMREKFN